nr:protocatechuate 3,4-dioxygenase subunit beta [Aminobacter lissarensis]
MATEYPVESLNAHPPMLTPDYLFTRRRAPTRPMILIPQSLTELSGPVYGHESVRSLDNDLTRQHEGEPIGERIIVNGSVMDESGRGIPNTLVEVWQANAAGRYIHVLDQHPAPLDPNFSGAGRTITGANGSYTFTTIRPGAYPVIGLNNVWRPAHIHVSLFGPSFLSRLVTQIYFEGDPLLRYDSIYNTAPDVSKHAMIAKFDMANTQAEWAIAYRFDIVLRGRASVYFEEPHAH